MKTEHPITPPPELVQQWWDGTHGAFYEFEAVATQAARWGADQELEACCEWINDNFDHCISTDRSDWLRAARRPKPLSLKEQALERCNDFIDPDGIIRRALEALPDV